VPDGRPAFTLALMLGASFRGTLVARLVPHDAHGQGGQGSSASIVSDSVVSAHRGEAEEAEEHDAAAGFVQSDEEFHGCPFFECA
jgi:hypothetical protein